MKGQVSIKVCGATVVLPSGAVNEADETFIRASFYIYPLGWRTRKCMLGVMELWATGFNAWSQLHFDGELPAQPRDLQAFKSVLKGEQIEILRTSLSATLGMSPAFLSPIYLVCRH
jgi:hypothetical protein